MPGISVGSRPQRIFDFLTFIFNLPCMQGVNADSVPARMAWNHSPFPGTKDNDHCVATTAIARPITPLVARAGAGFPVVGTIAGKPKTNAPATS